MVTIPSRVKTLVNDYFGKPLASASSPKVLDYELFDASDNE
jgi:hypothetical protein